MDLPLQHYRTVRREYGSRLLALAGRWSPIVLRLGKRRDRFCHCFSGVRQAHALAVE